MKDFVCIVCPKGCRLRVDEENGYAVSGNACKRGETYGREEAQNPTRMLTSTVCLRGAGDIRRCPVRLDRVIPKGKIREAMADLRGICLESPVREGQIAVENAAGTGANFIVTRNV